MNKKTYEASVIYSFNAMLILSICLLLVGTFIIQLVFKELPCPLCFLQRAGFMMTGLALFMNLCFGLRPSYYAMALLSLAFTSFVALRQIALHVIPGTGAYGSPLLGLHLYTWSFIIAMVFLMLIIIVLSFDFQYADGLSTRQGFKGILRFLGTCLLLIALGNIMTVISLCGFKRCPSNPVYGASNKLAGIES
jgi:hypothetical protein